MVLELRSDLLNVNICNRIHKYNSMRISHGNTCDIIFFSINDHWLIDHFCKIIIDCWNLRSFCNWCFHVNLYPCNLAIFYCKV